MTTQKKANREGWKILTNTELLRKRIDQSGYKMSFIAQKLKLSYQGLLNKINNKSEFKASEIQVLSDILALSDNDKAAIFFCRAVDKTTKNDHEP